MTNYLTMKRRVALLTIIIFIFNNSILYSQIENNNKLPVVNLEIASVSGESFTAPVWLKFYPGGTYDPDGKIIKFEMDFNSDGVYEVSDTLMQGGTFEYTESGEYTATVRVTDDNAGVTILTKTFTIGSSNIKVPTIEEKQETNLEQQKEIENKFDSEPIENEGKSFVSPKKDRSNYSQQMESSSAISESWLINQHNGFKGTLNIQILQSGQFSGTISWDRHESGAVSGQIYGSTIEFTISYSKGNNGYYKGTLTQRDTKIIDGTVKSSGGLNSTWDATKVKTNKRKTTSNNLSKNKPLTTARMYKPDSIIKSGRWGTAINIRKTKSFDKFKTDYMEPGIPWTNGMYACPGNAPTEMIYFHNASDIQLKGFVSILDCIDYCGSAGDCGFVILGNGKILWESGVVKHHDKPVEFSASLKGIEELRLIINSGGDNVDEDWGVWMDLKVGKRSKKNKTKPNPNKNIIINGSFEKGFPLGTFKTLKKGAKIPGWTVIKETVDLSGNYLIPADGKNSIDLNGTPGFGGIQQRFFTEKGKKYSLSFYLAGNYAGGPTIKKLLVSFGNQTRELEFDITGKSRENMGWEYHEFVFKAKDRATILKFESNHISGPTNWGPVIDDVKLVPYKKHNSIFGFKYGVLGGVSNYFLTNKDLESVQKDNLSKYLINDQNADIGFHLGFMTQLQLYRVVLRSELILNTQSVNYNIEENANRGTIIITKEMYFNLDVPVLLGYKKGAFRFMAGPVGHLFIGNRSGDVKIENFNQTSKSFTLGWQGGFGFDIWKLALDVRYEGSFTSLADGVKVSGKKVYFSKAPGRVIASLTYVIN